MMIGPGGPDDVTGPPPIEFEPITPGSPGALGETTESETIEEVGRKRKPANAGGRRRRKQAIVVVGIAIASAAAGIGIGARLKSPAERAAERKPPTASRITVPVEQRALSASVTLSGSIDFDEPIHVRLAGQVGASAGDTQVITRAPQQDAVVADGSVIAEISGRPVFAFQGDLPTFRSLEPGSTGPDVTQLETALQRLGYDPGPVDQVYDDATEAAIDAFYQANGYQSEGPSDAQRKALRDAQKGEVDAEQGVAAAKDALAKGGSTLTASDKLRLQQAVQTATDAVPDADAQAKRDNDAAAAKVTTDTGLRDAAKSARDAAKTILNAASTPGAINPDTGVEYTASELAVLQGNLADKEAAVLSAEQSLTESVSAQATTKTTGEKSVKAAKDALALAQLELSDAQKPADTTSLKDAVTAAQAVLAQAQADLAVVQKESGTKFPAGEMVFVPLLPSTITSVNGNALPGATVPTDELLTLSSTDTRITARISRSDAGLVKSGMPVSITVRDANIETTGVIVSIGAPAADPSAGQDSGGGFVPSGGSTSGSSSSGRLQVIVTPDDPATLRDWVGSSARVSVPVSSTNGEVLAVPVAALFVGPDGASQVEVERTPATAKDPGTTEVVKVKVGLTAQGFAEISAIGGGKLAKGDRVVVGAADSSSADSTSTDSTSTDDTSTDAGQSP